jgi:hypothetical protein
MTQSLAVRGVSAQPAAQEHPAALDPRRELQLALAAIWILDAMLQFQPAMFGKGFSQMLAGSAQGNPAALARPITWSAALIGHHVVVLNAIFAAIQLLLGLGIAFRPTAKLALAASVAWALGVWWLGEGLGGVLAGTASPLNGAPGAVLLYALLAVLLWPTDSNPADSNPADRNPADRNPADRNPADREPADREPASPEPASPESEPADRDPADRAPADRAASARAPSAPFVAARAVGRRAAQICWLVVWLGLAVLALLPASRTPQTISGAAPGEPAWLAWIDAHAASTVAHHGLLVSIVLAAVLVIVAVGPYLPVRAARAVIVLAVVAAAALWLAQGLGGILTGSGTDPNTGPLLALLALAFWPAARPAAAPEGRLT